MTATTKAAIREILTSVQSSGLAFGFSNLPAPGYPIDRALAEILELVDDTDTVRLDRLEALPGISIAYRPEDVASLDVPPLRSQIDDFLARLDEGGK